MHKQKNNIHIPVLLSAVLEMAAPAAGEAYLDLTAGYGGHAAAVLAETKSANHAVLVDRDAAAVEALQPLADQGAIVLRDDFLSVSRQLVSEGQKFDVILADLGVSSLHLDQAERGFSFGSDGPLDMRMDQRTELTAEKVVNTWPAAKLEDLLRRNGEEWRSRRIVQAIVAGRPFYRTAELAAAILRAVPGPRNKVHPATKTFQAIRIAVNDELGQLQAAIPLWLDLLNPGGRLLVISFHSLEDRVVKLAFADVSGGGYDAEYRLLTKHPVTADETELASNPRSRSAKLRGVAKIKNKQKGE